MSKQLNKITFIGLGKMGTALANRLLLAGFDLTVYNRTASKMQPLVAAGAKGAVSASEAVREADVVITSLLDDNSVVQTVLGENGFLPALKTGAIHIGTSTILPSTSKKLTQAHDVRDYIYLGGNVLGVPKVAEKGELTSIIAGNEEAINLCMPIFNAYSSKIIQVGTEPDKANVMKICTNYLLASTIECMGEIYAFAEKSGLDTEYPRGMFHAVFAHPAFKLYADKIWERNFDEVNFDVSGGFKDMQLFQQAFAEERVVSDMIDVIRNKFIIAMAQGMEQKDWSAVTEVTRKQAGLS